MFDGSYRSKPRAVNLGTNRGNNSNNRKRNSNASSHGGHSASLATSGTTTAGTAHRNATYKNNNNNNSNRDSILNEAHRLRMERHQKMQQNKAAIRIQQHIRGRQLRKRLLKLLYHRIISEDIAPSSTTCATTVDTEMSMVTVDAASEIQCESTLYHNKYIEVLSKQIDVTTLLNIFFRLQQPPQETTTTSQPTIFPLLLHFSKHIQELCHHPQIVASDGNLNRKEKILYWITGIMEMILFNNGDDGDKMDFLLQVRPNTFYIFKSILRLIPNLFVQQQQRALQSSTASSSSSSQSLSTNDIIIIMSYIMQLHQYPTEKTLIGKQEQQSVQTVMSIGSTTTILQMMIDSLTFMIDRSSPQRDSKKLRRENLLKADHGSLLLMRMFMMGSISTFIVNQPIMNDWCRPILGAVLLIYDFFHIDDWYDPKNSVVVSKFMHNLPRIMKVLRPIPPQPISSRTNNNNKTTTTSHIIGSSTMKEHFGDIKNDKQFVTQMVSQLISHYRIPILVILSRTMSGEILGSSESSHRNDTCNIDELNRTQEQKEIIVLSMCIQFLKFLLFDATISNNNFIQERRSDPEWNDNQDHFLFWMIQRAVRGDTTNTSNKDEQRSSDSDPGILVEIIDDSILDNDDDTDQHHPVNTEAHWQPMDTPMSSSAGASRTVAPRASSTPNPPHRRLTKHDLQTLPKLDKEFTDIVKSIDHTYEMSLPTRKSNDDNLQILVKQICDPIAWLRWGNILMSNVTDMDDDFYTNDEDMEYKIILRHGQDDYITLLALLLQATTSLRTHQNALSSPYLKVLSFSSIYMSNLWKYVLRQLQITTFLERVTSKDPFLAPQSFLVYDVALQGFYYSMSLFSDLFAHHLIAINDEQFVTLYTKQRPLTAGNAEQIILVDDVIVRMRTILNELYWTKPVRVSDLKVILSPGLFQYLRSRSTNLAPLIVTSQEDCTPFVRARLLLTGTKLYNALYERWCRLVTFAPFCDESLWWFPAIQSYTMVDNLITRDVDIENTTTERISITRQQQLQSEIINLTTRNDLDDPMEVDESSDDDENERSRPNIDEESDRLASVFSDPKMARLLGSIPQVLPFDRRVKMFDSLIRIDKIQSQDEASDIQRILNAMIRGEDGDVPGRKSIKIRRDELYGDSMEQLNHLGPKLKGRVHVSFKNQVGTDEAGIDGGGVFKEFIDDLIKDAFSVGETTAGHNLFSATPNQTLTVNVELLNNPALLSHYEFLGRVLGKAVYESILVEAQFCLPFLNQMLGKTNTIEDLKNLDAEYYKNLRKLLSMSKSDIESLCLTFELTIATKSTVKSIELLPNGGNISVTKANVVQYVLLVAHHRLNVLTFHQNRAFLRGFRDLVPASWVRLFSAHELQKVISGDDSIQGIDVSSLKKVMQYAAGYHPSQSIIEWFWEIIEEMTADQQRKFLKFMTSCSRQPLLGFGSLEPAPCIQQIRLPDSLFASQNDEIMMKEAPLPTSSTCMNLFKLPNYQSKEIMRRKVLAAIESGAGFELT